MPTLHFMTSSNSNALFGHFISGLLLSITSLGLGFYLGRQKANTDAPTLFLREERPQPPQDYTAVEESLESGDGGSGEDEYEDLADGDLAAIQAGLTEQCKLVLVVRTDLKMTPGKIAAQCGHATLACYKALVKRNSKLIQHWEKTGQAKIALRATSEDQLLELEAIAKSLNLCARTIQDLGRTQVMEGSRTVLGIGPAPINLINEVTGKLRLL